MALGADERRRSWPYPRTHLERLADRAGLGDDELRAHLRAEIRKRVLEREGVSRRVELKCEKCRTDFSLSARRAAVPGVRVLCEDCQYGFTVPTSRTHSWVRKLDVERRESTFAALAAMR